MFNTTDTWFRTAVTGRIQVVSSNLGAGQYVSRNLGQYFNLTTCDEYEEALRVRISPREGHVAIQCLNPANRRENWLGLAAHVAGGGFGAGSHEWAALTFSSQAGPSSSQIEAASTNTSGPVQLLWFLGHDGTLRSFWKEEGSTVTYCLDWSVELHSKRIYAVSDRNAYVAYSYEGDWDMEASVRLVFEPDSPTS